MYYKWSKEFLEVGKQCLAGDTARATTPDEVKGLRKEEHKLKEVVAEQTLEMHVLKKAWSQMWSTTNKVLNIWQDGDHSYYWTLTSISSADTG